VDTHNATYYTGGPIWTTDASKRVIPRNEVLLGVKDVAMNFGIQIHKTEILGHERTFKRKGKTSTFNNIKLIMTQIFTGNSRHEWVFVGGPTMSINKSKMADGGHADFRRMLIYQYWICTNLVHR